MSQTDARTVQQVLILPWFTRSLWIEKPSRISETLSANSSEIKISKHVIQQTIRQTLLDVGIFQKETSTVVLPPKTLNHPHLMKTLTTIRRLTRKWWHHQHNREAPLRLHILNNENYDFTGRGSFHTANSILFLRYLQFSEKGVHMRAVLSWTSR